MVSFNRFRYFRMHFNGDFIRLLSTRRRSSKQKVCIFIRSSNDHIWVIKLMEFISLSRSMVFSEYSRYMVGFHRKRTRQSEVRIVHIKPVTG